MAGFFVVFSLLAATRVSSQAIGSVGGIITPSEHHKNLDGCLLPNTKELMLFNETRSLPERCLQVTCLPDRTIGYQHCEPVLVPQECSQTDYNNTLPYPKCCPVMICNTTNSAAHNDSIIQSDTTVYSITTLLSDTTTTTTELPTNNTMTLLDTKTNKTINVITSPNNTSTNLGPVTHIQKIRTVKRNTEN